MAKGLERREAAEKGLGLGFYPREKGEEMSRERNIFQLQATS